MNSFDSNPNQISTESHRSIAPAWHTIVVLIVLFGLSAAGAIRANAPGVGTHRRALGYVLVMAFEWIVAAFIWYGVSRRGIRVRDLVSGSWRRPLAVVRDFGIAVGFVIVAGIVLNSMGYFLKVHPNQAIRNLLPHGRLEVLLYLLVVLTAGFCEELIFRGYLQRQLTALTRSEQGGIVLQGIAFGAAHGYQGWKYMLLIAIFGIMFGLLANWRRSLRPGMIAHALQDGLGGLAARHLMR